MAAEMTAGCSEMAAEMMFGLRTWDSPCLTARKIDGGTEVCIREKHTLEINQQVPDEDLTLFDDLDLSTRVWPSALLLAEVLASRERKYAGELAAGARVIELGCGLGMTGMVCATLGARAVLSDLPHTMKLLEKNITANFGGENAFGTGGSACSATLDWSFELAKKFAVQEGGFDFVIFSDCICQGVYGDSWIALADCLDALCGPTTTVLMSQENRVASSDVDGSGPFLNRIRGFLHVERLLETERDGHPLEVYMARRPRRSTGENGGDDACTEQVAA